MTFVREVSVISCDYCHKEMKMTLIPDSEEISLVGNGGGYGLSDENDSIETSALYKCDACGHVYRENRYFFEDVDIDEELLEDEEE